MTERLITLRERALGLHGARARDVDDALRAKRAAQRHEEALKRTIEEDVNIFLENMFGLLDTPFEIKRLLSTGRFDTDNVYRVTNAGRGYLVTDHSVWLLIQDSYGDSMAFFAGYDRSSQDQERLTFLAMDRVFDLDSLGAAIRKYEYEQTLSIKD